MIRTAIALAKKGLAVFPCLPRAKEPATEHGCLDATTDVETIRVWWRERPDCNIGVACGTASGIFVVDIDGLDAELEVRRLEAEHGALPPTVESVTARGRHLFFRMPATPVKNTVGKIAPGVDTRSSGAYVVAPPSVHPRGKRYEWSVDSSNTFADAPGWLLAKIAGRPNGNGHIATAPSEWRAMMAKGVPEGRRDATLARITGYLLRHHIDPVFAAGLVQIFNATRCLPPLPDEDVARICESIAGKELKRRQRPDG